MEMEEKKRESIEDGGRYRRAGEERARKGEERRARRGKGRGNKGREGGTCP